MRSIDDLPLFDDYSMQGRTLSLLHGHALYHFGDGLSYIHFTYAPKLSTITHTAGDPLSVNVHVTNRSRSMR